MMMFTKHLIFLITTLTFSTFSYASELTGNWDRTKVVCASGAEPQSDWQPWRMLLKFESPNFYTIIRQREEFTSFETGDYFFSELNRVCFKKDFPNDSIPKCFDISSEDRLIQLGEFMSQDGECLKGDYVIKFFKPQN